MKFKFIGLLFLIGLLAGGCQELDQVPQSTADNNAVFNSEKGLDLYANSFYDILPTGNDIIRSDEMSDFGARSSVPDFLRDGAFGPRQSSGWDWKPLRNINYFIENNNRATVPADTRKHYTALARLFRAIFYFEKVKRFGDVPWINKAATVDDPTLFNGRDPRTMVMDSVLADLNYACENIRTTTDNTRSLITKSVAYGYKSRICLFEGTFRKYQTTYNLQSSVEKWLNESISASEKVIKEGGFSLNETGGNEKSYRQVFINNTPVTNEVMLSYVCDPALSVYNDANWWWTSSTYGARLSFTRTFVNTYLNIDGTPFTDKAGHETMTFAQEVKGRDKRLQQTIRMGNYKRINGGKEEAAPPVFSYTYTGYQPIKWTLDDTYYDGGTRNINSISTMRYAEILLNYAEAKAELNKLTDADWALTVGAIRKRAGITGGLSAVPAVVDPYLQANYFPGISDPAILEIRRERGTELCLEGFRFYDIVRWKRGSLMEQKWNGFYVPALNTPMDLNEDGVMDVAFVKGTPASPVAGVTYINVAETISAGPNPQRLSNDTSGEITWLTTVPRKWEEKHYLYPIPETDRLFNPKLGQNPGW
ncbi:RagB/SusD family nutrient uptake outer membrane protein [Dyadobacter subterraneus]|uniref:RagB/SusD family nutrient uptake outer membrane protein n=1 Tax=Dyadobacter subterraneus TaxID=2773304 RepID=A0ABR9W735_9BACT|nr:RagB/SusD family nutrient uptake outer membrane protein [Dyadobacter subterraneus]MBE9461238.1 RagB/SusD family nutrient uptake outer membrane protein [Dyadobacter subterraneus]